MSKSLQYRLIQFTIPPATREHRGRIRIQVYLVPKPALVLLHHYQHCMTRKFFLITETTSHSWVVTLTHLECLTDTWKSSLIPPPHPQYLTNIKSCWFYLWNSSWKLPFVSSQLPPPSPDHHTFSLGLFQWPLTWSVCLHAQVYQSPLYISCG